MSASPSTNTASPTAPAFMSNGGEAGALMRAHDWAATPLGPSEHWPPVLQILVRLMLASRQPMFVVWGSERLTLYNDGYTEILMEKHPAMGRPFEAIWPEIWDDLAPMVDCAYCGQSVHMDHIHLTMQRRGYLEEAYFSFSYTPVYLEDGTVAGFFCPCTEITEKVLAERRSAFRATLTDGLRDVREAEAALALAARLLGAHLDADRVAFGEIDPDRAGSATLAIQHDWSPAGLDTDRGDWRFDAFGQELTGELIEAAATGRTVAIDQFTTDTTTPGAGATQEPGHALIFVPLPRPSRPTLALAVASTRPRRWSKKQVRLTEEVTERTWAVVERVRADTALRESEATLRAVLDQLFAFVGLLTLDGVVRHANAPPLEAAGITLDDVRGKPFEEAPWWSYDPARQAELRAAMTRAAAGETVRYDVPVMMATGQMMIDFQIAPLRDERGRIVGLIPSAMDISARTAREEELRLERELLETIINAVPVMITLYSPRQEFLLFNAEFERATGWSTSAAASVDLMEEIYPDPAYRAEIQHFMDACTGWKDIRMHTRGGRELDTMWANVRLSDGRRVGIGLDVSERKEAERHRQLLVDELNHRVKNTLAVVQAMSHQTFRGLPGSDEAQRSLQRRLTALSAAHELLTRTSWQSADLEELARATVAATSPRPDAVSFSGPRVLVEPKQAVSLAMAFHELSTNALKYGALSEATGQVQISWSLKCRAGEIYLDLTWLERGGPRVSPPQHKGFGSIMIEQALVHELDGKVAMIFSPEGLECRIEGTLRPLPDANPGAA